MPDLTSASVPHPSIVLTGWYRVIGKSLDIRYSIEVGAGYASPSYFITVSIPSGFTMDSSKLLGTYSIPVLGDGIYCNGVSAGSLFQFIRIQSVYNSTTDIRFVQYEANISNRAGIPGPSSPVPAGTFISMSCFGIPIV